MSLQLGQATLCCNNMNSQYFTGLQQQKLFFDLISHARSIPCHFYFGTGTEGVITTLRHSGHFRAEREAMAERCDHF